MFVKDKGIALSRPATINKLMDLAEKIKIAFKDTKSVAEEMYIKEDGSGGVDVLATLRDYFSEQDELHERLGELFSKIEAELKGLPGESVEDVVESVRSAFEEFGQKLGGLMESENEKLESSIDMENIRDSVVQYHAELFEEIDRAINNAIKEIADEDDLSEDTPEDLMKAIKDIFDI